MYDLKQLQNTELSMLMQIHNVCEELGIKYVILSGTLLGAVRHKGFIPWDDDIDIGMCREDYELFLKKGQELLPSNLFIQHYTTEPGTNNLYIKVRNQNTLFLEKDNKDFNMSHGIFVDVFPFDKIDLQVIKKPKCEYYRRRVFNIVSGCYSKEYINSVTNPFKRMIGRLIYFIICSRIPISHFFECEDNYRKRHNDSGSDCYLLNMFSWNGTVSYNELFERKLYSFENEKVYGPVDFNKILALYYGSNYMELPPLEQRITHKPLMVLFDSTIDK